MGIDSLAFTDSVVVYLASARPAHGHPLDALDGEGAMVRLYALSPHGRALGLRRADWLGEGMPTVGAK